MVSKRLQIRQAIPCWMIMSQAFGMNDMPWSARATNNSQSIRIYGRISADIKACRKFSEQVFYWTLPFNFCICNQSYYIRHYYINDSTYVYRNVDTGSWAFWSEIKTRVGLFWFYPILIRRKYYFVTSYCDLKITWWLRFGFRIFSFEIFYRTLINAEMRMMITSWTFQFVEAGKSFNGKIACITRTYARR